MFSPSPPQAFANSSSTQSPHREISHATTLHEASTKQTQADDETTTDSTHTAETDTPNEGAPELTTSAAVTGRVYIAHLESPARSSSWAEPTATPVAAPTPAGR